MVHSLGVGKVPKLVRHFHISVLCLEPQDDPMLIFNQVSLL